MRDIERYKERREKVRDREMQGEKRERDTRREERK